MSEINDSGSTVNEYLTKIRNDNGPGIVKPLFEENIKFEFWGQCIEELKENIFYIKEYKDPHEHISNIIGIIDLFHSPRVARDQVMLMAFPFTLKEKAKQWMKRSSARSELISKPPKNPYENITNSHEKLKTKETAIESGEKGPDNPRKSVESYDQFISFPGQLKKEKEKEQFRKFFENLQQLSIKILFFKALEQMPKYAKFMKDLLARKGKTEETYQITFNEICSALLLNKIPFKEKNPRSFTILCVIGKMGIDKALADLRASISLMTYSMYVRLDLGNETITFIIEKSMKFSSPKDDECLSVDMVDKVVSDLVHDILPLIPLDSPTLFATNTIEAEKQPPKLKELQSYLEYAFLKNNQEFPVIISSLLNSQEKESLLKVLTQHKATLAWKVADIKGISPSFCTHKILMEDNFKPVVQPQQRLNPKVQDVVEVKIVKLLDSGLIYTISDSPWIAACGSDSGGDGNGVTARHGGDEGMMVKIVDPVDVDDDDGGGVGGRWSE
nr:hypothetical protein [Tanacetum cinerariifolium]